MTTAGGDGIRMIGGMAEIMIAEQAEIENNQTENMTVLGIKNFSVLKTLQVYPIQFQVYPIQFQVCTIQFKVCTIQLYECLIQS